jgi:proliferating cell nuclear antigen
MPTLFKAKTHNAYIIKILAELLHNNIKTACFEVDKSGIQLCTMDSQKNILIKLKLESDKFTTFVFNSPEKILMGINLNHFNKILKSVKKKDMICLFIDADNILELGIKVIPKENVRITTSFITIQNIQSLDIDIPTGYGKSINIPSSEYNKMCKDLSNIGTSINIKSCKSKISFISTTTGIIKRHVEFGDTDEESDSEDNLEYDKEFKTDQFCRVSKITGLSNIIQIFTDTDLPFMIKSEIGNLGYIQIYIKNNSQQT